MRPLLIIFILIIILSPALSGCATIITGTGQKVQVTSEPSGVAVQVDGKDIYTTPAKIRMERKADHVLIFKKEGYKEESVRLLHVISGAFCSNVFLGGPIGMAFDALTGAQFKLVPDKVNVKMQKETP